MPLRLASARLFRCPRSRLVPGSLRTYEGGVCRGWGGVGWGGVGGVGWSLFGFKGWAEGWGKAEVQPVSGVLPTEQTQHRTVSV